MNKKRVGTYYSHFHPTGTCRTANSSLLYEVYTRRCLCRSFGYIHGPLTVCLYSHRPYPSTLSISLCNAISTLSLIIFLLRKPLSKRTFSLIFKDACSNIGVIINIKNNDTLLDKCQSLRIFIPVRRNR